MQWRPLSKRTVSDPKFDEPVDGLPSYLHVPIREWMVDAIGSFYRPDARQVESVMQLQIRFKLDPPLDWYSLDSAVGDLIDRMFRDDEFGLDVIDYVVAHGDEFQGEHSANIARRINGILLNGGSAWEVVQSSPDSSEYQLQRRTSPVVQDAVRLLSPGTRAEAHMTSAWNSLQGRNPDASKSYRESVRAVEAAAKPVITPNDSMATLGKMIPVIRDSPDKWQFDEFPPETLVAVMELLWKGQLDRHGTDDHEVPLEVTLESADVALHASILLVRVFSSGAVRRIP